MQLKIRPLQIVTLIVIAATPLFVRFPVLTQTPIQAATIKESEQQAFTIYQPIQDIPWEGQFVSRLGIPYFSLGEVAEDFLSESDVELARANKDRPKEAIALSKLGIYRHALGEYDKAINYYKQSLAIAKETSDHNLEVMLLGNLGLAYSQVGDYAEAVDYLEQYWGYTWHKGYYYNGGDRKLGGIALGNLGNAYFAADLYAKAIEYHQKRVTLSQEIKDRQGESKALLNLGIVYHALGEYDKAIAFQQQSLAIAKSIGDRFDEGQALSNLGIVYHTRGEYNKAVEYQQQYLALSRQIKNLLGEEQALGNLGGAYYFLGDYAKAIDYYQQSLAIAFKVYESKMAAITRGNLGLAYFQQGDYNKAIELYKLYFNSASYKGSRREEGVARNNLAAAYLKSGNLAEAEKNLLAGIKVWESLRTRLGGNDAYKVSIFETQATVYNNLQKLLVSQNKVNEALEISERGRARAFVELLSRRLSPSKANNPTPPTIEQIKQIAKTHNATLVEYSIVNDNFKVQNTIQSHESELLIWTVKPTGEVALRRTTLKPLWQQQNTNIQNLVVNSRESIGVRGRGLSAIAKVDAVNQTKELQQLHKLLIQPIADLLPSDPNARVIFLPQGELFLVPFAALQDSTGKYLIEQHTILTSPAIQVLDFTYQQRQRLKPQSVAFQDKDMLIVGNPTMPSIPSKIGEPPQQLPSLPGAEAEAKAIAQLFNTQAIIGALATKASILQKLPKARIVHLATHGLLDDFTGSGVPGAIALAPSGKDNGLLTASEIVDLKLNAELVVLSACDTGRGRITGDGVIGLSRSLILSGVPSAIVSLWSVPDAPTASLMTEFYQNTLKNSDKAQAMRQAAIATMKQYPDPKDWAAFTLIGEAD